MAVYLGSNKVAAHGGLPSGGGGGSVEAKDVNFYDYDGTIVASYSKNDFLALTQMPANPDHSGDDIPLTSKGWNWSLTDAKTYVTNYGVLEIGQVYQPTDNKTHIVIEIPEGATGEQLTFQVRYQQTTSGGVTVGWGDGSNPETDTGTTIANRSHTYIAPGTYDITLNVTSGTVIFGGSTSQAIYGSYAYNRSRIQYIYMGSGVAFFDMYTFRNCFALTHITISNSVTIIGADAFEYCYALRSVTLPTSVTTVNNYAFRYCYMLMSVAIPKTVTSIGTYVFANCYALKTVTVPASITSISNYMFQSCYTMRSVTIPATVTSIETNAFQNCYVLASVTIPSNITSIGALAFSTCYGIAKIRLLPTTPPTLSNTNAFTSVPESAPFIVPDDSVTTYKGASNWSTYASRIIGESDV